MSLTSLTEQFPCIDYIFKIHNHCSNCEDDCKIKNDAFFRRIKECNHSEKDHEFFILTATEIEEKLNEGNRHNE